MKSIIKIGILIGVWLGIMIGVSIVNNFIMLSLHDLSYYYTWDGMKTTFSIVTIESLILIPGSIFYFKRFFNKSRIRCIMEEEYNVIVEEYRDAEP